MSTDSSWNRHLNLKIWNTNNQYDVFTYIFRKISKIIMYKPIRFIIFYYNLSFFFRWLHHKWSSGLFLPGRCMGFKKCVTLHRFSFVSSLRWSTLYTEYEYWVPYRYCTYSKAYYKSLVNWENGESRENRANWLYQAFTYIFFLENRTITDSQHFTVHRILIHFN